MCVYLGAGAKTGKGRELMAVAAYRYVEPSVGSWMSMELVLGTQRAREKDPMLQEAERVRGPRAAALRGAWTLRDLLAVYLGRHRSRGTSQGRRWESGRAKDMQCLGPTYPMRELGQIAKCTDTPVTWHGLTEPALAFNLVRYIDSLPAFPFPLWHIQKHELR